MERKKTKRVYVGNVAIGDGADIVVESMTKVDSHNEAEIIEQIHQLENVGCRLVRIALPDLKACDKIPSIKSNVNIPIVGDVHFDYRIALKAIENGIDGLRLNPGNLRDTDKIKLIVRLAKEQKISIRVGVNSGSINRKKYSVADAEALVESAMEHIKILEEQGFEDIIVSLKSTNVLDTIEAYEKFAKLRDYPLHIGITEAGTKYYGTIKSAVGLGILLYKGLGDTIRVSLSSSPVDEVIVGYKILQALDAQQDGPEIIACPTCARKEFDVQTIAEKLEKELAGLRKNMKIAIMGCVVNGPGEAKQADIGIAGVGKKAVLFVQGEMIKTVEPEKIVDEIVNYIRR